MEQATCHRTHFPPDPEAATGHRWRVFSNIAFQGGFPDPGRACWLIARNRFWSLAGHRLLARCRDMRAVLSRQVRESLVLVRPGHVPTPFPHCRAGPEWAVGAMLIGWRRLRCVLAPPRQVVWQGSVVQTQTEFCYSLTRRARAMYSFSRSMPSLEPLFDMTDRAMYSFGFTFASQSPFSRGRRYRQNLDIPRWSWQSHVFIQPPDVRSTRPCATTEVRSFQPLI